MVYNLAALHDVNTGIILTALIVAYFKNRSSGHGSLGLIALVIFILSVLPTPFHGTGILGIAALLTMYFYLYRIWGINREVTALVTASVLLMMLNIVIGLKLRGIF